MFRQMGRELGRGANKASGKGRGERAVLYHSILMADRIDGVMQCIGQMSDDGATGASRRVGPMGQWRAMEGFGAGKAMGQLGRQVEWEDGVNEATSSIPHARGTACPTTDAATDKGCDD